MQNYYFLFCVSHVNLNVKICGFHFILVTEDFFLDINYTSFSQTKYLYFSLGTLYRVFTET